MGEKGTGSVKGWQEELYGLMHPIGAIAQRRWARKCLSAVFGMIQLMCDADRINYTISI